MSQFLDAYSIQHWLESCPQGYLHGTEYGHAPGAQEPELMLTNPVLREETIRATVHYADPEIECDFCSTEGEA